VEPLYSEELLLAIPRGHALHLRRRVTLEDLSGQPFVLLNETHCLGATIVQFCDRGGCTPAVTCRSAQLLTVQELVGAGHGVSLIPEMAAKADRSKRIHYRSLAGAQPMRTVAMVRHRQRYLSPLVRDLMDLLRQQAQRRKAAA
jgi:LysR family hydrogen peroxide-inducible transcriptional activator